MDFVGHLVLVYREVFRVLRQDGQNWLNIGDKRTKDRQWYSVPEMLLSALVAEGWRHEDTIIWQKPSAMPGSQTCRFTRDFEKVYLLNKSTRAYLDLDAVREKTGRETSWEEYNKLLGQDWADYELDTKEGRGHSNGATAPPTKRKAPAVTHPNGRTRRTVWSISPKGTNLNHYAAFPVDLVTPMIRCSISERGVCPKCGKPWMRLTKRKFVPSSDDPTVTKGSGKKGLDESSGWSEFPRGSTAVATIAWHPSCTCYGSPSRGPVTCGKCGGTGKETRMPRTGQKWIEGANETPQCAHSGNLGPGNRIQPIETGRPCPACSGTGTVTGDVWPDADDWEIINTPVGERTADDPTLQTGRAGYNRPRGDNEGTRPITRWQQRRYAEQLRNSLHREEMEQEAGSAFAHYIRTDKSGARPVPPVLLERWIERGWVEEVGPPAMPPLDELEVAPSIVLDPFCGTGTVGAALASLQTANRYPGTFIGLDLKHSYLADLSRQRLQIEALDQWEQGIDGNDGKCLDGLPLFEGLSNGQT